MMTDSAIIAAILGKPTFASLVVSESIDFADLESTYPAAAYSGKFAIATINGKKTQMTSNGTEWAPVNGQCVIELSGVGYGIMPSGTVSTGSSGHFVSGTALPHTYSEGLWMYFAATSGVTPALTAGFYWCVFSNTTTCTIYTDGPGSAAYDFSVGAATTGSTLEITMRTVSLPAGIMGDYGQLAWDTTYSQIGNGNNKNIKLKLDSSTCLTYTNATAATITLSNNGTISNRGAAVQYSKGSVGAIMTTATTRTTVDTTAAIDFTMTMQMAVATDYMISHHLQLNLYK